MNGYQISNEGTTASNIHPDHKEVCFSAHFLLHSSTQENMKLSVDKNMHGSSYIDKSVKLL